MLQSCDQLKTLPLALIAYRGKGIGEIKLYRNHTTVFSCSMLFHSHLHQRMPTLSFTLFPLSPQTPTVSAHPLLCQNHVLQLDQKPPGDEYRSGSPGASVYLTVCVSFSSWQMWESNLGRWSECINWTDKCKHVQRVTDPPDVSLSTFSSLAGKKKDVSNQRFCWPFWQHTTAEGR